MKYAFFATILFVVLALELILQISQLFGAIAYFTAIVISLIAACRISYLHENKKQIILVAAMILAIKATSLFLPFSLFWKTLIAYLLLAFISVFYSTGQKVYRKKIKIKVVAWAVSAAVLLGYAGMTVGVFEKNLLIFYLIPLIVFSEEYLFRGLLLNSIEKEHGKEASVAFTSLFYGLICLGYGIIPALFFFAMSLLFGFFYIRTRSLLFTMVLGIIVHVFLFIGNI